MTLTDGERAYLQRMVYETAQGLFGSGTIFAENTTPDYVQYQDLVDLATPEVQRERDWWTPEEADIPPKVAFPWASPQALHERAEEMRQSPSFGKWVSRVPSPQEKNQAHASKTRP